MTIKNHEVKLVLDGEEEEVPCIVTRDNMEGETFSESLMYCIRLDTNEDILQALSFDQLESIEHQITTNNYNPFTEGDDTDGEAV